MNNIIEIRDFMQPELDVYARISEGELLSRNNPENSMFIAESPKVIQRAIDVGCIPVSFLVEKKHIQTQAKDILDRCMEVPVYTAEFDVLTKLTGFKLTRGMLCAMKRPAMKSLEDVCSSANRIAVLENVMNPTNLGAIFRSAAALGIDGIVLTNGSTNPLYRRAIRVSMGTVFQIPWTFVDYSDKEGNIHYIEKIKKMGFKTAAMALRNDTVNIDDKKVMSEERLAIILGTEGEGLDSQTIALSDYTIKIPMAHGVDSLNVAAASAVAFWQLSSGNISR